MPHQAQKTSREKKSVYTQVTNRIIKELEQGVVPWVKPWNMDQAAGLPINADTGRSYSGINILLLWGALFENNFRCQTWLTFRQAQKLGGTVRKGERSNLVVYADKFTPKEERELAKQENREAQSIPFLKRYHVFNIEQCDGLPEELYAGAPALPEREQIPRAETLIKNTGANFHIGGNHAFYCPSKDMIQVPPQTAFTDQINYYRTCFHEAGHWTGHPTRLNRKLTINRKTKDYAREELVAEMTSAFVCATLSITPTVRHADYIGAWLAILKEDDKAVFRAASQASKAADFLLGFEPNPQNKHAA